MQKFASKEMLEQDTDIYVKPRQSKPEAEATVNKGWVLNGQWYTRQM